MEFEPISQKLSWNNGNLNLKLKENVFIVKHWIENAIEEQFWCSLWFIA